MSEAQSPTENAMPPATECVEGTASARTMPVAEVGGREAGLDPVRYGDWEKNGRCIDF